MLRHLKELLTDDRGAITTVEVIGYTILFAGAAALVGFGLTAAYRGLTGSVINEIQQADPNQ